MPCSSRHNGKPEPGTTGQSSSVAVSINNDAGVTHLNTNLNLNPVVMMMDDVGQSCTNNGQEYDYNNDEYDDDDMEELPEEEQQQLQQMTSLVEAAYRRVDRNRADNPAAVIGIASLDSSATELELSEGLMSLSQHPSSLTYTTLTNMAPVATSSVVGGQLTSSAESQTTRTSDFLPPVTEDGNQLLERLESLPDNLDKALTINQMLQRRISSNIEKLEEALRTNLRRQLVLHDEDELERYRREDEKRLSDSDSRYFLRISSFCRPYFKTKIGMPAPMNEDARERIQRGYLDMYQARNRPWSSSETRRLVTVTLTEAKEVQLAALRSWERDIRRAMKKIDGGQEEDEEEKVNVKRNYTDELEDVAQQLQRLQGTPVADVKVPIDLQLDWIKIAAQASDGHRSPDECQFLWDSKLNTNVSQGRFTEKDDVAIQTAVKRAGSRTPDWISISKSLSEPRSPFQVFQRYQSFIGPALNPVQWTAAARQQLIRLVEELCVGDYIPWTQVHQQMPGFSRSQLQAQWKRHNPNRRKGPFTRVEDALFLKALYKYGYKLEEVLKFLPHRNKDQLRDRFRRVYVTNFTTTWTQEMDAELLQLTAPRDCGRLDAGFWRRLAAVDGFASTGKDAGMLRLRLLILQLWREVAGGAEPPPPLFPISITTDPVEIQEMTSQFLHAENVEIRSVVEKINAGRSIKLTLSDLENRRKLLHRQHDHHRASAVIKKEGQEVPLKINHLHLHHLHQQATLPLDGISGAVGAPLDRRMIRAKRAINLTWPEQMVLDFFLPSKLNRARQVNFGEDENAEASLQLLLTALQVRPLPVQPSEVDVLSRLNITETEMKLVNSMVNTHTCSGSHPGAGSVPCVWCTGTAVPECIPLLAPSNTTVSALQSLLLHKPVLQSMASGAFILHKFTGTDVRTLGIKHKSVQCFTRPKIKVRGVPTPGTVGKVHITSLLTKPRRIKRWIAIKNGRKMTKLHMAKRRRNKWTKRSIIDIYKSYKTGKFLNKYQGAKKEIDEEGGAVAETSGVAAGVASSAASTGEAASVKDVSSSVKSTSSAAAKKRGRPYKKTIVAVPTPPPPPPPPASDSEDSEDTESSCDEAESVGLSVEELRQRSEGDNLLKHRFMALFLWPAVMTLGRPSPVQEQAVDEVLSQMRDSRVPAAPPASAKLQLEMRGAAKRLLEQTAPPTSSGCKKRRPAPVLCKKGKVAPAAARASNRVKKLQAA